MKQRHLVTGCIVQRPSIRQGFFSFICAVLAYAGLGGEVLGQEIAPKTPAQPDHKPSGGNSRKDFLTEAFDISLVASWPRGNNNGLAITAVKVIGNLAYVSDDRAGLKILDVSDPANPLVAGRHSVTNYGRYSFRSLQITNNLVFTSAGGNLTIFDISDPINPQMVSTYGNGQIGRFEIHGNLAYVLNFNRLEILDITNPAAPVQLGTYYTPGATDVKIINSYAYLALGTYDQGIGILNVTDPGNPNPVKNIIYPLKPAGFDLVGNVLFVAAHNLGLRIFDVSDPANPQYLGGKNSRYLALAVKVAGDKAYVSDGQSGLQIYSVTNLSNPQLIQSVDTGGFAYAAEPIGSLVYIADDTSLEIVDLSDLNSPKLLGAHWPEEIKHQIQVEGNTGFHAESSRIFSNIDLSDPTDPDEYESFDLKFYSQDFQVISNTAYVAGGEAGLKILDVTPPTTNTLKLRVLGTYVTPSPAQAVRTVGPLTYLAHQAGFLILNVSTPTNITLVGNLNMPTGKYHELRVSGNFAYLAAHTNGVKIINISDPANPQLVGTYDTPSYAKSVDVAGTSVYIADDQGGLQILDVANPANPQLLSQSHTNARPVKVQVVGDVAYLATSRNGLQIVDISEPTTPSVLASYQTPMSTYVDVQGEFAYLLDIREGAKVLRIADNYTASFGVQYNGPAMEVYWTAEYAGYDLQQTTSMSPPVTWTNVDIVPEIFRGKSLVVITNPADVIFFRLIKEAGE